LEILSYITWQKKKSYITVSKIKISFLEKLREFEICETLAVNLTLFFRMGSLILGEWFHTTWLERVINYCLLLIVARSLWYAEYFHFNGCSFLDFYLRLFLGIILDYLILDFQIFYECGTLLIHKKRKCVVKFIFLSTKPNYW
jgi:hypothetical protein